jgi:hypothetical protein
MNWWWPHPYLHFLSNHSRCFYLHVGTFYKPNFSIYSILILVWYNNQLTLLSPFQCTCNQCFKNLYIHVLMFLIWVGYTLWLNIFLIYTKLSNFVFDPTKKMTYFFFNENFYEKKKISQVLKFKDNFSRIKNKSLIVLFYDPIIFQKF